MDLQKNSMALSLFKEKNIPIALLMTSAIFIGDFLMPFWYDIWVLYLVPLVLMFRSAKRPYLFSVIVTLLIVAGLFLSHPDTGSFMHGAANRITAIFGGWGVSVLLMQRKRMHFSLLQAHNELERRIGERTAELSQSNGMLQKDIAERKKIEEALRDSEERYRLLFHETPIGIFNYDTQLILTAWNDRFVEILQSSSERLSGLDLNTLKDHSVIPAIRRAVEGYEGYYEGVYKAATSRAEIWVSMRTTPIRNEDGRVKGGIGIVEDITERKLAEERLYASEISYHNLFDSISDAIFIHDEKGHFIEVNKGAESMYGYPREFFIGKTPAALAAPGLNDLGVAADAIHRAFSGAPQQFEFWGLRAGGEVFPEDVQLMPATYMGSAVVIAVARDITERIKSDEARMSAAHEWSASFDAMADGVSIHSTDYTVINVNQSLCSMLGKKKEDMIGRKCHELFHGKDSPIAGCPFLRLRETNLREFTEFFEPSLDKWLSVAAAPIVDDAGTLLRIVHTVRDVTERKQKEQELGKLTRILRARNKSSRAMIEAEDERWYLNEVCRIVVEDCGHTMVWIGFTDDNEDKTVRPVAYAGHEEGYLEYLTLTWRDKDLRRGPINKAMLTGNPVIIQSIETDIRFAPWRAEALGRGYASMIAVPLLFVGRAFGSLNIYSERQNAFTGEEAALLIDLAADLSYGISAIRTRSAQVVAEKELRNSEKRYRSLFENMSEGLAYCRMIFEDERPQDFIYLDVNSSFEQLTGLKDVVGKRVSEVIPGIREADPELFEIYGRVALTGEPERFEVFVEALNMWFSISAYCPEKGSFVAIFDVITERKRAAEALAASEKKYRLLHETMRDAFVSMDMQGRITEFNKAYREMLGYSQEELLKLTYANITPAKWHAFETKIVEEQVLARGFSDIYEKEYRRKNGTFFPIELRKYLLKDDSGNPVSMWAIVRDITDRKKAEGKIKESEARFRGLIEKAPVAISISRGGTTIYVNHKYLTLYGFESLDEVVGQPIFDQWAPESREMVCERVHKRARARLCTRSQTISRDSGA
ncbi:MAG: PAS domain S-box protein, partial [Dissulfurispiraceae bacterium]